MQSGQMIQCPDLSADSSKERLISKHVRISPNEAADRLAIQELVEAYAKLADRRDENGRWHSLNEEWK
jgi:hypothetical protein